MAQYRVFISYRTSHAKEASAISYELERRYDGRVFFDANKISGGQVWQRLEEALRHSEYVMLLITQDSFDSSRDVQNDFYLKEIQTALQLNIPIIPVFYVPYPNPNDDIYRKVVIQLKSAEKCYHGIKPKEIERHGESLFEALMKCLEEADDTVRKQRMQRICHAPIGAISYVFSRLISLFRKHPYSSIISSIVLCVAAVFLLFPELQDKVQTWFSDIHGSIFSSEEQKEDSSSEDKISGSGATPQPAAADSYEKLTIADLRRFAQETSKVTAAEKEAQSPKAIVTSAPAPRTKPTVARKNAHRKRRQR